MHVLKVLDKEHTLQVILLSLIQILSPHTHPDRSLLLLMLAAVVTPECKEARESTNDAIVALMAAPKSKKLKFKPLAAGSAMTTKQTGKTQIVII
jgi:hypothetical protein